MPLRIRIDCKTCLISPKNAECMNSSGESRAGSQPGRRLSADQRTPLFSAISARSAASALRAINAYFKYRPSSRGVNSALRNMRSEDAMMKEPYVHSLSGS